MSIAALVRGMAAAGAPAEAIALAVEAIEAEQNKLAEKRAQAAARKRAQRERDGRVTVTGQGEDRDATGSLDKGSPDTPSKTLSSEAPLSPPKTRGKKAISIELPDWMPAEPWAAFVAMRKAMRNVPFTEAAAKGIVADLDRLRRQGHDPEKLLLKAVKRGWRGVFEADDTKANGSSRAWTDEEKTALLSRIAERERGTGPPQPIGNVAAKIVGGMTAQ